MAEGPATKGIDIGKTAKLLISLSSINSVAKDFFFGFSSQIPFRRK